MLTYILRRLVQCVFVILGVTVITFLALHIGGDPTYLFVSERASPAEIEAARRYLGFDQPLHIQYLSFLWRLLHADMGVSLTYKSSAFGVVMEHFPATIELTVAAFLVATVFAIPLGVFAALHRGTAIDGAVMTFAMIGQSMPSFWLGIILILTFGLALNWLPLSGHVPVLVPLLRGDFLEALRNLPQALSHLLLPAVTVGLFSLSRNARLVRSSMLEVLSLDFVRTARAKGQTERGVVVHHALRNAWLPVITVLGLEFRIHAEWSGGGRDDLLLAGCRAIGLQRHQPARHSVGPGGGRVVRSGVCGDQSMRRRAVWAARSARPCALNRMQQPDPAEMLQQTEFRRRPSAWRRAGASLVRAKWPIIAMLILAVVTFAAALGPSFAPRDPNRQNIISRLRPPMLVNTQGRIDYPLGTDALGRDVLSRLIYGARISIAVGLAAVVIGGLLGVTLGLVAGYRRGWVDDAIMRVADVQLAFPTILLAIMFLVVLGPGLLNLAIVLGIGQWVTYARIARAQTINQREKEYVEAARALGDRTVNILFRTILPNILSPLIVIASFNIAGVILSEAALSFLGLGVPPTIPTWGGMLAESRDQLLAGRWWLAIFPGVAIMLTVLSFNILGDWLRDFLDPRLKAIV